MTVLTVPQYYLQTDSATKHGDRMCFSSTMAMAIKYLAPTSLMGVNADDDYLKRVLRYGDTTQSFAQIKAAADYGIKATFQRTGSLQSLRDRLMAGLPVPVGILHHGPSISPFGGGHWMLVVGLTDTYVVCHDPFGRLNDSNGGYPQPGKGGKYAEYALKHWLPRWEVEGKGTGWFMDVRRTTSPTMPPPMTAFANTWKGVKAVADRCGAKYPEVVAAQWALESGFGKHTSGRNNFFGIKGDPGTTKDTKEFINGKWITIKATFKDYSSPESCIKALIQFWYKDYKGFKGVNRATSPMECCQLLQKEGYATDPTYPQKLINLIKENN
jgi:hypothetical protein